MPPSGPFTSQWRKNSNSQKIRLFNHQYITYIFFFGSNYSWKKVHQFLHCLSTQRVHRSIVEMIVRFWLITVRSATLDAFYCDFLYFRGFSKRKICRLVSQSVVDSSLK